MSYDGENGSLNGTTQGQPSFLLDYAALVGGSDVGTFSLGNVPAGTYNLFLYGTNYDGTRGASFSVASGTPLGGYTTTIGPNANPAGPLNSYILGVDHVEYLGVTPDNTGAISGTWSALTNPNSGLFGEGDFNGLQLVSVPAPVPEPASIALIGMAGIGLLSRRRRKA